MSTQGSRASARVQGQINAVGGANGLLSMVMGIVYPSIKPMFETCIRRLTVTVKWKEGPNEHEFSLVQYVTNPQRSGFVNGVLVGDAGVGTPAGTGGIGGSGTPAATPGFLR